MKKVLWIEGTFDTLKPDQSTLDAAEEIANSDFNVVIFGFIHCMPKDQYVDAWHLVWNNADAPLESVQAAYATAGFDLVDDVFNIIKNGGPPGRQVLFSIGGYKNAQDFARLDSQSATFYKNDPSDSSLTANNNLPVIIEGFGIDGFDIDLEGGSKEYPNPFDSTNAPSFQSYLANLVQAFPSNTITMAPVSPGCFWVSTLENTLRPGGGNLVSWLNVQPHGWPDVKNSVVDNADALGLSASNVGDFIVKGIRADEMPVGDQIDAYVANQYGAPDPAIAGAYLWKYSAMKGYLTSWTNALKNLG